MSEQDRPPSHGARGARRAALGAGLLAGIGAIAGAGLPAVLAGALAAIGAVIGALALGAATRRVDEDTPRAPRPEPEIEAELRLLAGISLPVATLDSAGRIGFANDAARRAIPRLERGQHFSLAFRVPDLTDALRAVLEDGGERRAAFHLRAETTTYFEAHIAALPRHGVEGGAALPAVLIVFEDRTRARLAEHQHVDFVANASHELKTPLASLSALVETLEGPARDDAAARARFLPMMAAQIGRMTRLVEDLISLSGIELNEHVAPRGVVDPRAVLDDVERMVAPLAERNGQPISIDLSGAPAVIGDRDQLERVFVNLIDNALKYGRGPEPVRVYGEQPRRGEPGLYGITVSDTGPGISWKHRQRLTERFYRVDVARSRAAGGTGLGLAIVKHIVARHRGLFEIDSEPGQGSRFTVWLPIVGRGDDNPAFKGVTKP